MYGKSNKRIYELGIGRRQMGKILVTGANGFIGRAVVKQLTEQKREVIAVIRNEQSNIAELIDLQNVKIVYCDMDNVEQLISKLSDEEIDICFHFAWEGSYGDARGDYDIQLKNVGYSMELLHVLKRLNVKRFVGIGTLAEKDVLNYHGTDGAMPNKVSLYGVAKITTHFMTKTECTHLGIEHIWCYLGNTYGIGNNTGNFVNFAISKMLQGERAAFTTGEQMYDFVNISDAAQGIVCAGILGEKNTAYYVGSGRQRQLKEYIFEIRDAINPNIELYLGEIPFNGKSLADEEYDCSKLIKDTGYSPKVAFREGIKDTISWLKTR